jgi:hypothetical protein
VAQGVGPENPVPKKKKKKKKKIKKGINVDTVLGRDVTQW